MKIRVRLTLILENVFRLFNTQMIKYFKCQKSYKRTL